MYTASLGVQKSGNDFRADFVANDGLKLSTNSLTVAYDNSSIGIVSNLLAVKSSGITNAMLAGSIAASKLVGTDITTVGTVTSGTWSATAIGPTKGGTNQTAWTTGDILYASASNTLAKLPIGTSSQVLQVSGGIPAWGSVAGAGVGSNSITYSKNLDTNVTATTISNTTAETTIYSYSVPANTLGTNKMLSGILQGTYVNNSAANRTLVIRIKYGGTTLIQKTSTSIATSATTGYYTIQFNLGAQNSASIQEAFLYASFESGTATSVDFTDRGVSAVDSTATQTLSVTVAFVAATATQTLVQRLGVLNMLNATDSIGVPTTRTITAGTGLTGGGDLSDDRTLSIDTAVVVDKTTAQTLTNKTLTAPIISTISNTGTLTLPTSTDTLVGRATTDTLTNKTLTSPVISTISNSGTLTLPTSTDTLVGRATTDTLTNKTLTTPTITKPVMDATNPTAQTYTPSASGTATLDLSLSNQHYITMPAGNITIALSNVTNNQIFVISILQDGTGSRTVTWFTTIRWAGGAAPTLTTTASKRDTFIFIRTGSSTYDGFVVGQNI